jgi:hypothetical protein
MNERKSGGKDERNFGGKDGRIEGWRGAKRRGREMEV